MNVFFSQGRCSECDPTGVMIDRMRNDNIGFDHVDVFLSRRKTAVLRNLFSGGREKWVLPVVCVDRQTVGKIFDSNIKSNGRRVIMFPSTAMMLWVRKILDTVQR